MAQWFRGGRNRLPHWQQFYRGPHREVPREASMFAAWAHERMAPGSPVVDLGAGTGRDAVWMAQRGHPTVAADFNAGSRAAIGGACEEAGVQTPYRRVNLESLRSTLVAGAQLAREAEPRNVYARGVIDAVAPTGREGLWRFCALVGRRGGLTFLEFRTPVSRFEPTRFGPHPRTYADPDGIVAEVNSHGGAVLERVEGRGLAPLGAEDPDICRLAVSWKRS
jgi:hypothetical protein